ncbi:DUF2442 domain-containing protein [Candidatus Nitrospira salsa]
MVRLVHHERSRTAHHEIIGNDQGIHWPDIDKDISVRGILSFKV